MPSIKDFDKKKKKSSTRNEKKNESGVTRTKDRPPYTGSESFTDPTHKNDRSQEWHASQTNASKVLAAEKSQQRRPSKAEKEPKDIDTMDDVGRAEAQFKTVETKDDGPVPESFQSFSEPSHFELQFPGSFLFKAKVPKAFDLAERIAGEWVNDGKFEALPVGHPLAQILASKALLKAKSLEKNVLNSAPITLAKIGFEYAKSKIKR